jgi:hypothetical protein
MPHPPRPQTQTHPHIHIHDPSAHMYPNTPSSPFLLLIPLFFQGSTTLYTLLSLLQLLLTLPPLLSPSEKSPQGYIAVHAWSLESPKALLWLMEMASFSHLNACLHRGVRASGRLGLGLYPAPCEELGDSASSSCVAAPCLCLGSAMDGEGCGTGTGRAVELDCGCQLGVVGSRDADGKGV